MCFFFVMFVTPPFFSRGGTGVNVAKTLDLLKAVMQSSFNQEIKKLCDDYFQVTALICFTYYKC